MPGPLGWDFFLLTLYSHIKLKFNKHNYEGDSHSPYTVNQQRLNFCPVSCPLTSLVKSHKYMLVYATFYDNHTKMKNSTSYGLMTPSMIL